MIVPVPRRWVILKRPTRCRVCRAELGSWTEAARIRGEGHECPPCAVTGAGLDDGEGNGGA